MTGKRFTVHTMIENYQVGEDDLEGNMVHILNNGNHMTYKECCDLLNTLHEENMELLDFKERVFNSIDGKIKGGEEAIEWGKNIGANSEAMGFYIEMLKRLKKELFENDGYN